ncbi:hypothetical protein M2401_005393 [Pseudomonas sp. JUb42]|nr:hypothetical protein [Pseudomonas sp. JUb42]
MHKISLTRHPNHRMWINLAGLDDFEAMELIEAAGAGVFGVFDQAYNNIESNLQATRIMKRVWAFTGLA